jgi:hypothetical protein
MRQTRWALAGVLALVLAGGARAQNFQNALTGVKPENVQFRKVDTSATLRAPVTVLNSSSSSGFSLTNFFRRLVAPSPKSIQGMSAVPAPQYKNPFMPLPPVASTINR